MSRPNISSFRKIGNTIYTSGVTGNPGDVPTQIRSVMEKLRMVLTDAGTGFENVVRATVYLSDLSYREQFLNDIWNEYFPDAKNSPARTTVLVGLGREIFVEIEMIARSAQEVE